MNEFSLIQDCFDIQKDQGESVIQGIGDDCAIVEIPEGYQLCVSMDTLVSGVHFPVESKPYDIGYKALVVNLSDCAAMGAKPLWATLALTLPNADKSWLAEFAKGFFVMANSYNIALIGGDTTRGPLSITVQIHGIIPKAKALLRSEAKFGDDIYVTGTLGDAGLGLQTLLGNMPRLVDSAQQEFIETRLNRPSPRVSIGQALQDVAHACIDISDGLAADLQHILTASKLGAVLDVDRLPLSTALQNLSHEQAQNLALYSGDDYELCFTAPTGMREAIERISQTHHCAISRIGSMIDSPGLFRYRDNELISLTVSGFQHF
ncbi:MAG: thiamine-phosphate kinase [Gammaproteobacteria bacterium]|nr:thiamine-phosphate kinase [Gammaproteobacteria bacterium]